MRKDVKAFKNKPELLAPAGNFACVRAAVESGADSVYLGLTEFGARSYADNFTEETFKEAVSYCHLRGVKVYVTLNTLVSDKEIPLVMKSAVFAAETGADAALVQDMGLFVLLRRYLPSFPVHISTQAAVLNSNAAAFYGELGAERCVLARELSFEEIRSIKDKNPETETEIFVHGAQCYCYSGLCLMSSFYGGRSGNRGKCAGPCRLPYILYGSGGKKLESGYLLSPVDMCLGNRIDKVLLSGADCLKIEGRMKSAEYVAAVSGAYRKAIDEEKPIETEELKKLESVFSRGGFTSASFDGKPNRIKKDSSNDDAYAKQDEKLLRIYGEYSSESCNNKKTPVEFVFRAEAGKRASLETVYGKFDFTVESKNDVQAAKAAPLSEQQIYKQLEKTGAYPFWAEKIKINIAGKIFIPVSEINELRRNALEELSRLIIESGRRKIASFKVHLPEAGKNMGKTFAFTAFAREKNQLDALKTMPEISEIYCPAGLYAENYGDERLIPAFPPVIREKNLEKYINLLKNLKELGAKKLLVSDMGIAKKAAGLGYELIASADANIFNSYAAEAFESFGFKKLMLSGEFSLRQIENIKSVLPLEIMVYGRLALMKTANCPLKGKGFCGKNVSDAFISDRKGEKLGIVCDCPDCTAYILNSKPLYMADKLGDIPCNISSLNLCFTTETAEDCKKIINLYNSGDAADFGFTRGHFYKAVL